LKEKGAAKQGLKKVRKLARNKKKKTQKPLGNKKEKVDNLRNLQRGNLSKRLPEKCPNEEKRDGNEMKGLAEKSVWGNSTQKGLARKKKKSPPEGKRVKSKTKKGCGTHPDPVNKKGGRG